MFFLFLLIVFTFVNRYNNGICETILVQIWLNQFDSGKLKMKRKSITYN